MLAAPVVLAAGSLKLKVNLLADDEPVDDEVWQVHDQIEAEKHINEQLEDIEELKRVLTLVLDMRLVILHKPDDRE